MVEELLHYLCCFECNSLFAIGCVKGCSKHVSSVVAEAKYCSLTPCRFHPFSKPECTKIAHRCSLAIFTADKGIAGNSAARIIFTRFHRRTNRGSLAIFFAEKIAHLGASKSRAIFPGAVKIATATAENRAILVHSAPNSRVGVFKVRERPAGLIRLVLTVLVFWSRVLLEAPLLLKVF